MDYPDDLKAAPGSRGSSFVDSHGKPWRKCTSCKKIKEQIPENYRMHNGIKADLSYKCRKCDGS
jgi:hypothetical protein